MPTIADVRKKYPQYDDLSDEQLADGFHKKFYSDIPREDFMAKLGIIAPARVGPEEINELPEPSTMSAGEAALFGAGQGATLGLADELGGAQAAAGPAQILNTFGPLGSIASTAIGAGRAILTDAGADAYNKSVEGHRGAIATAETERPGAFLAGNVGGALVTAPIMPAAKAAQGAGIAGRALAGAKTGAGYGAAYGVGTGETAEERLEQGATGGLAGGLTGGAASPVVDALIAGGRAVKNAISPILGAINPDQEAARRVVGALEADAGPGAAQRAVQVMEDASNAGLPMIAADTGGDMTRALARSSANTSPAAREALQTAVGDRFENQAPRFGGFVQEITGASGDTAALQAKVNDLGRRVNKAAYDKADLEAAGGVWDEDLAAFVQAPSVQDAIRKVSRTSNDAAVLEKSSPVANPFTIKNGRTDLRPDATPSLRFWDHVQRNLRDEADAFARKGRNADAKRVGDLRRMLLDKLDATVPAFRDARRGASAFFDAEDALEAGTKFVQSNIPNEEAKRVFDAMSGPEKELFRQGYANELLRRVNAMGDSKNVAADSLFKSERGRNRLDMVFGKPAARRVEALVEIEKAMNVTKTAVQGNSSTTRQLIEAGLAGGAVGGGGGLMTGDAGMGTLTGALLAIGMRRGYNLIDGKVAERVGRLLASENPDEVRKAVNMISRNPRLLAALRAGQEYIGRLTAPVTGSTPVPAMISGRAEDEQ